MIRKILISVLNYLRQVDKVLLLLMIALPVFGTIMVASATTYLGHQKNVHTVIVQAAAVVIGFACAVLISNIDYHALVSLWKPIAAVGILLMLIVLVVGKAGNNQDAQKLWITIPIFGSLQPSELVKVAFILTFARHCDAVKDDLSSLRNVTILTLHAMIPIGLVALEKDWGMMSVFLIMFICMMFAANLKARYFAGAGIALLAASPLIYKFMPGKIMTRVKVLFDPSKYAQTEAFQQLHGVTALGSGETWGWGLFKGSVSQSKVTQMLTQRENDMIFSVVGEELGFVGCVLLLAALAVLMFRVLSIARKSGDMMGSVICAGVFAVFAYQTLANVGMNLMLFPVIGITLPFISQGGSSMIASFLAVGLALSVYMRRSSDFLFVKDKD